MSQRARATISSRNARKQKRQQPSPPPQNAKITEQPALSKQYVPSLSLLFRIFSIVRIVGALTSPIQDCDEVYNYWEPLHLLQFGTGKQTWEHAPQYALRSFGYLYIYKYLVQALHFVLGFRSKSQVFFAVRISLALFSSFCEALFVRQVAKNVDRKIANYTILALFGMAGLFHSTGAVLPTTFAMHFGLLATAMQGESDFWAVFGFSVASVVGWPYAIVVAVPFVLEALCVQRNNGSRLKQVGCLFGLLFLMSTALLLPMVLVDSWHYGRLVIAPWNQVSYNVLGHLGGSSQLYGTEPWYFYFKNGLINGNIVMLLALLSLPMWLTHYIVLKTQVRDTRLLTAHTLLLFRILPFFLVLLVFSLQPHKEERFLSLVYPHMCFNAAVVLSLLQPLFMWCLVLVTKARRQLGINATNTHLAWATRMVDRFSICALAAAAVIGVLRMAALSKYYGAPVKAFMLLPKHGKDAGILPLGPSIKRALFGTTQPLAVPAQVVCMGRDWHRFPSSYWLPQNSTLVFIQTDFNGLLPGDFFAAAKHGQVSTAMQRTDFNALNEWEPSHAIDRSEIGVCDFIVDTEPYVAGLRVVGCERMLDAEHSSVLGRVLYVPELVVRLFGIEQQWTQMCVYQKTNENS
ncbi:mannosyltransferase [Coemansia spiralis]|uniref:Mannosyltransferase n=2 Tax=Coemansia TaxID=4863 RepID=A0A9W8G2A1_9FUNG|nr:mannosyltransferase [Coemansia umbellata]KAJ2619147.1 mannosyltransferase [Coemansia sp. RSA 1358]KAJ2670056.1 mannosyltransferase [Coemansia spiralis]